MTEQEARRIFEEEILQLTAEEKRELLALWKERMVHNGTNK